MSGATLPSPTRLYDVHAEDFNFIYDPKQGLNSRYKSSSFYHTRNIEFPNRLKILQKTYSKINMKLFEFQVSVLIIYLWFSAKYSRKRRKTDNI
jgi:hypothetical protein